jgi:uncharacterized membrane protein YidH (DUF202 family)
MNEQPRGGFAAERTQLAWGRSALSFVACGFAVSRGIPGVTDDGRPVYGLVLVALGALAFLATSPWRSVTRRAAGPGPRDGRQLMVTAVGTMLIGIAALVVVLVSVP